MYKVLYTAGIKLERELREVKGVTRDKWQHQHPQVLLTPVAGNVEGKEKYSEEIHTWRADLKPLLTCTHFAI